VIKNNLSSQNLILFLFISFPITFLIGSLLINLYLLLITICLLVAFKEIIIPFVNEEKKILFIMLFYLFFLIINLIFSDNWIQSFPRVSKFLLIFGQIIAFKFILKNSDHVKYLYKTWVIIFLIVLFDIIFEIIIGNNIFGNKAIIPGRISSFSGDDMNIGHFFSAFVLIALSYFHYKYQNNTLNSILALGFIIVSFLIGERANFIKTFIIISIFSFYSIKINIKYFLVSVASLILFAIITLNINQNYKLRYINQISNIWNKGITHYLDNSVYGSHFKVAEKIFKENFLFGVGIKNFRISSFDEKYEIDHRFKDWRGNTHPHQIHYELLSETGIVGYISFWILIILSLILVFKGSKQKINLYQLSGLLFVLINLLPLIPSGSFFSTFSSGLFWLNYALMIGYTKKLK
jgi:O-antigen ligase